MRRLPVITSVVILLLCLTIACGRKAPDAPPDKTPPAIASTNPALGTVDVPSNTAVTVTFSEPVDEKTITFVLMSGGTDTVPGTMSYSDKTAVFTPSGDLAYSKQYIATMKAGVTDMLGNVMPSDYPWSFTTGTAPDTIPPTVLPETLSPSRDAVNVSIYPTISVTFSEPMNPSTVNPTTFKLNGNGADISGTVTLDDTGMKAIYILSASLAYNTTYTVTIVGGASGVKDMAGNALVADYLWSFKTALQPPYTITASAGANGTISPAGSVGVNSGAKQEFTIAPNTGYHVANVLVDGTSVGAVTNYTFTNVTANHTIAASFSINTNTITATAGANGSITPSGAISVSYGANQTFTISPATNYHVADVLVDGVSQGPVPSYQFTNVTVGHTISASFAINTFTITTSAGTGGTISPTNPSVNYGANQTLTFTPNAGYSITSVIVDGVSQNPVPSSYTFTNVTANHTVSASFAIKTYTVTPSVSGGNGSISPSTAQTVNYNANASFTLTPATGYSTVIPVGGTCGGTLSGNIYTTNAVTANCTVVASFAINIYSLTVTKSGTGTGTVTASTGTLAWNGSIGAATYPYGTAVTLTASPDASSNFSSWTGCDSTVGSQCTVNVNAAKNVSVAFTIKTFTIAPSSGANGSISPNTQQTVNYGASQMFTFTPITGYYVSAVTVDDQPVPGLPTSYTFTNVMANHTIKVNFDISTFTITPTAGPGGTITPSSQVLVNYGGNSTFTIKPTTGYHIMDVQADGVSLGPVTSYTFTNVTAGHTISASFAINTNTITATAGANGSITPAGAVSVSYGANQTFTITPDTGFSVDVVLVDGVSQVPVPPAYTFSNVTAGHTISATFL